MRLSPEEKKLLEIVARQAYLTADSLPAAKRAELFEGIALLLPEAEAERAKLAAFSIQKSEKHQLELAIVMRRSA